MRERVGHPRRGGTLPSFCSPTGRLCLTADLYFKVAQQGLGKTQGLEFKFPRTHRKTAVADLAYLVSSRPAKGPILKTKQNNKTKQNKTKQEAGAGCSGKCL